MKTAKNRWRWLKMGGIGWQCLEMGKSDQNGWIWLEVKANNLAFK